MDKFRPAPRDNQTEKVSVLSGANFWFVACKYLGRSSDSESIVDRPRLTIQAQIQQCAFHGRGS